MFLSSSKLSEMVPHGTKGIGKLVRHEISKFSFFQFRNNTNIPVWYSFFHHHIYSWKNKILRCCISLCPGTPHFQSNWNTWNVTHARLLEVPHSRGCCLKLCMPGLQMMWTTNQRQRTYPGPVVRVVYIVSAVTLPDTYQPMGASHMTKVNGGSWCVLPWWLIVCWHSVSTSNGDGSHDMCSRNVALKYPFYLLVPRNQTNCRYE